MANDTTAPRGNVRAFPAAEDDSYAGLMPEGEYELAYVDYSTAIKFAVPRVVVRFRVVTQGEHFGAVLARWYRVRRLIGDAKKRGNFDPGPASDCFREFCRLFPDHTRRDRISYVRLKHHIVVGFVKVVDSDARQRPLVGGARYNNVAELLRLA